MNLNLKPKVIITRDDRDGRLARILQRHGFATLTLPVLRIRSNPRETIRSKLAKLSEYDWCIFVSPAAAFAVGPAPARKLPQIAAIGTRTAAVCRKLGWPVRFVPQKFTGAKLATAAEFRNQKVLLFCGNIGSREIYTTLKKRARRVTRAEVYRNTIKLPTANELKHTLAANANAITFTSPSAADNLRCALRKAQLRWSRKITVACIGPTTAATARRCGFPPSVIATPSTLIELARMLKKLLK